MSDDQRDRAVAGTLPPQPHEANHRGRQVVVRAVAGVEQQRAVVAEQQEHEWFLVAGARRLPEHVQIAIDLVDVPVRDLHAGAGLGVPAGGDQVARGSGERWNGASGMARARQQAERRGQERRADGCHPAGCPQPDGAFTAAAEGCRGPWPGCGAAGGWPRSAHGPSGASHGNSAGAAVRLGRVVMFHMRARGSLLSSGAGLRRYSTHARPVLGTPIRRRQARVLRDGCAARCSCPSRSDGLAWVEIHGRRRGQSGRREWLRPSHRRAAHGVPPGMPPPPPGPPPGIPPPDEYDCTVAHTCEPPTV